MVKMVKSSTNLNLILLKTVYIYNSRFGFVFVTNFLNRKYENPNVEIRIETKNIWNKKLSKKIVTIIKIGQEVKLGFFSPNKSR